jgi:hypothetical protein
LEIIMADTMTAEHEYTHKDEYVSDTRTTLRFTPPDDLNGTGAVTVFIKFLPGLMHWKQPPASVIRGWVDELLKGTGWKRDWPRVQGDFATMGWRFIYYVKHTGTESEN